MSDQILHSGPAARGAIARPDAASIVAPACAATCSRWAAVERSTAGRPGSPTKRWCDAPDNVLACEINRSRILWDAVATRL